MKNLTKLIGSIGLAGALSFGGWRESEETSKKFPYDEITFTYYLNNDKTNKMIVEGTKRGNSCTRGKIIYEDLDEDGLYDKFQSYIHLSNNKVKSKVINAVSKPRDRFDYKVSYLNLSLKTCEFEEAEEKIMDVQNKHSHDLSFELRNTLYGDWAEEFCSDSWKEFLNKEFGKELSRDTISSFQIFFSNFLLDEKDDLNFFPKIIQGYAKNRNDKVLCELVYKDTDGDRIYDDVTLLVLRNSSGKDVYKKEEAKYKLENFYYFGNSGNLSIRERTKEIMDVKMNCEANPSIRFLYEEYIGGENID